MADDNKENSLKVQADNHSAAVGKIEVGRDLSGNINIGGTQTIIYSDAKQAEDLFKRSSISIEKFEPETVLIPAGRFLMGGQGGIGIPVHESSQFNIDLPEYRIGKYPITVDQFSIFIQETGMPASSAVKWDGQQAGKKPVIGVTWYDALAYCDWLKKVTGRNYTLPNEAQWEKACRGGKTSIYPWGDTFDAGRCNFGRTEITTVDAYPAQNEFECFDLVGNIRQWTCTLWGEKRPMPDLNYEYPWREDGGRNNIKANRQIRRVLRGASLNERSQDLLRCSSRRGELPDDPGLPGFYHGFRVAIAK